MLIISKLNFEVGNSFELQIIFKISIHIYAQSCTWKELMSSKKSKRLFSLLRSQQTFNLDPITLAIIASIQVGECFLHWIKWLRYHVEDSRFSLSNDVSSGK